MRYLVSVFGSGTTLGVLATNIILAWGLYITLSTGQFSIGHAAFIGIGAYSAAIASAKFGFPLLISLIIGMICAGLLGVIIGFPVLRIRGLYLTMVTVGANIVVVVGLNNWPYIGGPMGFSVPRLVNLPILLVCVLVCGIFMWLVDRSAFGRSCRAVSQDPIAAVHSGISLSYIKITAFVIGSALAGLAGGLYGHFIGALHPGDFGLGLSLGTLLWVILGGGETLWGPVAGAVIFIYLQELFRFTEKFKVLIWPSLVLAIVIIRPQGLISKGGLSHLAMRFSIFCKRIGSLIGVER